MELIRPLVLTWLEAGVLLHYYWRGLTLGEVADTLHRHVCEVQEARRTLVAKFAVALGYATERETGVKLERIRLPLTPEERRQEAERLRRQGWKWGRIAERLGVTKTTLWADRRQKKEECPCCSNT
ncbi:MAG TPA: hypothetical protein GX511_05925 [Firmicutes bacterium]|nr:hypothetical protein [Bacillota bacterium]